MPILSFDGVPVKAGGRLELVSILSTPVPIITGISLSGFTLSAGQAAGTPLGPTVSVAGINLVGVAFTYTMANDDGGRIEVSSAVALVQGLTALTAGGASIQITVTPAGGAPFTSPPIS